VNTPKYEIFATLTERIPGSFQEPSGKNKTGIARKNVGGLFALRGSLQHNNVPTIIFGKY
jgi:hypothetical protein